ncbi:hypothetical protein RT717_03895 [Imperialibacter roseus]|uniref:Uncharacterized protein n=1 Tax=Imperialibacter roseus TaxID=1324217 RepID=A0ABZ0IT36_9BACT|nr:hypothetical protein [Imperialibacter roseus]WOK07766.1 hypothetical protein RT717_03895 [Imperialibacter roseus]
MNKVIKTITIIIAVLGVLVFLGYRLLILMSGMHPIPSRTLLLNNFKGTQTVEFQARDDQKHIHGLLLEVHGNISDTLTFTFGMNDSTIYRTEQLTPGIVDFKYSADWYSTLCFLTFEPTTDSIDGELQLEYKFFGE